MKDDNNTTSIRISAPQTLRWVSQLAPEAYSSSSKKELPKPATGPTTKVLV